MLYWKWSFFFEILHLYLRLKLKIPKIVRHDIGWELITGMKHTSEAYEHTYMKNKKTPLRREHRYYEKQK